MSSRIARFSRHSALACALMLVTACGEAPNEFSGKYQDADLGLGVEFLSGTQIVFTPLYDEGADVEAMSFEYQVIENDDEISLRFIGGELDNEVVDVEKTDDTLIMQFGETETFTLEKVDEFAVTPPPAFTNQANRARESEAKTYVGSLNRAQQAFYIEYDSFSEDFAALGLGISQSTNNYDYESRAFSGSMPFAINTAQPKDDSLKGYLGIVRYDDAQESTAALLCEADMSSVDIAQTAADTQSAIQRDGEAALSCPEGMTPLS